MDHSLFEIFIFTFGRTDGIFSAVAVAVAVGEGVGL